MARAESAESGSAIRSAGALGRTVPREVFGARMSPGMRVTIRKSSLGSWVSVRDADRISLKRLSESVLARESVPRQTGIPLARSSLYGKRGWSK